MKKSLTLWVFCIVALGTLEALAQGPTNTIEFKEVPLNKALDSVAQRTGAKIYYAQDWGQEPSGQWLLFWKYTKNPFRSPSQWHQPKRI